ncbi:MAG: hypothetical protein LBG84_06510 [Treponema sp.]|jgi:hypothetical protein|nr:hypothetical protein [Treponema sp.]
MDVHRWFKKSGLKAWLKMLLPDSVIRKMAYLYNGQWRWKQQHYTPMTTLGFETHIVEHCNLPRSGARLDL